MSKCNNILNKYFLYWYWLNRICQIFVERVSRPWLSIDWIYKLTTLGRESEQCISVLHDFTNKVESFFYTYGHMLLIYWPDWTIIIWNWKQVTRDRREMLKREEEKKSEMLDNVEKISSNWIKTLIFNWFKCYKDDLRQWMCRCREEICFCGWTHQSIKRRSRSER